MKAIKAVLGAIFLVVILSILDREIGYQQEGKVNSRKGSYVWAWVCILALAVLGLCNKCAFGQTVPIFYAALDDHIQGQTVCNKDQEIAILINSRVDSKDTLALLRIVNHELVHVQQLRQIGNCELASIEYQKNPLLKEIPAYCFELKSRSKETGDALGVITQFVTFMHNMYGKKLKLSFDDVLNLTDELCLSRREYDPP